MAAEMQMLEGGLGVFGVDQEPVWQDFHALEPQPRSCAQIPFQGSGQLSIAVHAEAHLQDFPG